MSWMLGSKILFFCGERSDQLSRSPVQWPNMYEIKPNRN